MNNLKGLLVSLALTSVLAVAAFAGEMPCPGETNAPPCVPGELSSPPCTTSSATTSTGSQTPGELSTPPASNSSELSTIAEAAAWALALL